jgi:hypothetical protein
MKRTHTFNALIGLLLIAGIGLMNGCGKPDGSANVTGVVVTVTSVNGGKSLQSDVVTHGYTLDDEIPVTLKSDVYNSPFNNIPSEFDNTTPLDTITFSRYHASHVRSDGGPNPPDFSAELTFIVTPTAETTVNVVVVRAFDKNRSPLKALWNRGQIFTIVTVKFYGEDGYGNDVVVSGSLPVSFANFPDSEDDD